MSAPDPVREALEAVEVPGAGEAARRAWPAVAGAHAARAERRRARPGAAVAALAVAAVAAIVVILAVTPPGAALADWVGRVLDVPAPRRTPTPAPRATLGPLPPGRLLVTAGGRAFVVHAAGHRVALGRWSGVTWSPRGRFVAAWRGRELAALTPAGAVRWRLRTRGIVHDARWSPDGFRVAFRADDRLAVVAGDGTGARVLAASVRATAPAWRPGAAHELAWVRRDGRITVADVDTGRQAWRSGTSFGTPRQLAWSADGTRLLVRRPGIVRIAEPADGRVRRLALGRDARADAAAYAPHGRGLALLVSRPGGVREVVVDGRRVFATTGDLRGLAWSPDARRLLVRWQGADQWLLLPAAGHGGRVVAIGAVGARFGGAPAVRGWCCSRVGSAG